MKLVFDVQDNANLENIFAKLAEKFKTYVFDDDHGFLYIISKPDKLQIAQKKINGKTQIYVWGAKKEHIDYFTSILGEPLSIHEEKRSPLEFAQELTLIPDIQKRSKEEVMGFMNITEKDLLQYKKLIGFACRKSNPDKDILFAKDTLDKL